MDACYSQLGAMAALGIEQPSHHQARFYDNLSHNFRIRENVG
jgi:hypothetical protein